MIGYGVACFLSVMLVWYNPHDASWNTAGDIVLHPLGIIGSYGADVLIQTLGYGSWFLVFFALTWSHGAFTLSRMGWSFLSLFNICLFFGENGGGCVGYVLSLQISRLLHVALLPLWPAKPLAMFLGGWGLCRTINVHISHVLHHAWLNRKPVHIKNPFLSENSKNKEELDPEPLPLWSAPTGTTPDLTEEEITPSIPDDLFPNRVNHMNEFQRPTPDLLDPPPRSNQKSASAEWLNEQSHMLSSVLQEFGVRGDIVNVRPGPVVTMFEFRPAAGIKTSRVIALADDIARSMSALSARIAVVPGQNVIGIELPNKQRQTVYLRNLLMSSEYAASQAALPLILGQDIGGNTVVADLARMPHLLVAGTTGSGKSVAVNAMILSLLYRYSPNACKFIMIDPKMLELSIYDGIPHLLTPVVTEPKKAITALKWAVKEMENRYLAMSRLGVRNMEGYNTRLKENTIETCTRRVQTGFDPETGKPLFENQMLHLEPLPYIVVVVDEMADLMMVAGKEIESAVQRLAQMARAAGIHLIMATQRPSVDVITGTIKANFPTRISFQVTSKIDSRTILGEQGAEQLLGQGDMLFMAGGNRISRVHGPYMRDEEVDRVVKFLKAQIGPQYIESITLEEDGELGFESNNSAADVDELYNEAVTFIQGEGKVSTSFIQRRFQIGYNRAARIVEHMEKVGIVTPPSHTGKREVVR